MFKFENEYFGLIGSRALKTNTVDSDWDFMYLMISDENRHFMEVKGFKGKKADIHNYRFENKEKVLKYIKDNNSSMCMPALTVKEFRDFFEITKEDIIEVVGNPWDISDEILNPHEKYILECIIADEIPNQTIIKHYHAKKRKGVENNA